MIALSFRKKSYIALRSIACDGRAANEAWANATEMSKGYWVTEVGAFDGIDTPMVFPGVRSQAICRCL
jgi:hypothetical protein